MQDGLGTSFTPFIEKSFRTFLTFVFQEMIHDNYDVKLAEDQIKDVEDTWAVAKTLGFYTVGDELF